MTPATRARIEIAKLHLDTAEAVYVIMLHHPNDFSTTARRRQMSVITTCREIYDSFLKTGTVQ